MIEYTGLWLPFFSYLITKNPNTKNTKNRIALDKQIFNVELFQLKILTYGLADLNVATQLLCYYRISPDYGKESAGLEGVVLTVCLVYCADKCSPL